MKKRILSDIKTIRALCLLIFVYFLSYNTYFGWNQKAITEAEKLCDNITVCSFGLVTSIFISVILKFIRFVSDFISNNE